MENSNVLIEYKGGGYDGCFWEWNFFMFDDSGEFHDIFSSGYKGIDNEKQAVEFLKEIDNDSYVRNRFKPTIYDLNDSEEMESFVNEGNAGLMMVIAVFLYDGFDYTLYGNCYQCGKLFAVRDMLPENYSGDGGIVYSAKDLYCEECAYIEMREYD